jgi:rubrerythrin
MIPVKNTASAGSPPAKSSIRNTPDTSDEREDAILKKQDNKMKKTCGKCGFRYLFDPYKNYPQSCPNCGAGGVSHLVTTPLRR